MSPWALALVVLLGGCQPSVLRQIAPVPAPMQAEVVSLGPAMAHVLAGDLARARGDESEAVAQYRIALLHDPGSAEIEARLAAPVWATGP